MRDTKRRNLSDPQAPVDFVIITALEEERDAVLSKLRGSRPLDKGEKDIHTFYSARVSTSRRDKSKYQVIVTSLLNMGPITATAQTVAVVSRWRPRYVLLVGIACGIQGEVCHGDVLIASQVADYTLGKQLEGRRQIRWEVFPCGASLLDSANNVRADWQKRIGVARPSDGSPARHKGVIASGGDVIYDDKIIATYSESWPKLIGIEMESGGVAAGVHQTPERPEFLMIKSVSDFGKDKHDPLVKPWRAYACHSAAAFTISLIRSGPARSLSEIEEGGRAEQSQEEKRRAAERQWEYIQRHQLRKIKFLFLLKANVGLSWFKTVLDETRVSFQKGVQPLVLGTLVKESRPHGEPEDTEGSTKPSFSFWRVYEGEPGYWYKTVSPDPEPEYHSVAGIDGVVPWAMLGLKGVDSIRDLSQLTDVGMSISVKAFEIGVEEFEIQFVGDTFSFSVGLSEQGLLSTLHEFSHMQHTVILEPEKRMPMGTSYSGVQLLDMFLNQFLELRSGSTKRDKRFTGIGGMSGPGGREISFYPSMPASFHNSPEAKKYSFTIHAPQEIDFAAKIEELKRLIESNPADADSYLRLASLYFSQGRLLESMECLTKAIKEMAPNKDVHRMMGRILMEMGRNSEAIAHLNKSVALDPHYVPSLTGLGIALAESGQQQEAIKHFHAAANLAPSDATLQKNLGLALARNGQYKDAVGPLRRAVELGADDRYPMTLLGSLLDELGEQSEAGIYLERAARMEPPDAKAYEMLGSHHGKLGELEKAAECFRQALAIEESSARIHQLLGGTLANLGHWDEAEKLMRRALELAPSDPSVLSNLGAILGNLGKFEEAITHLLKAAELDPQNTVLRMNLEQALRAQTTETKETDDPPTIEQ
jgi:Flp pilus assembly protein TadD/nucleoside phosphorylase